MNIHTGDSVVIITGKDKGKTGKVLRVLEKKNRVVVADCNIRTKHVKKTAQSAGQRVQYEASLHASNVMLIDNKTKKRTRIGYSKDEKGKKNRIAKKSGEVIKHQASVSKKKSGKVEAEEAPASAPNGATVGKKESKEAKGSSKKEKDVKKAEAGTKPQNAKPFWKKMGFGEAALEDVEDSSKGSSFEKDNSVPDQGQTTDSFSHQRGK